MRTNNSLLAWNNGLGPIGDFRREMSRVLDDFWTAAPEKNARRSLDADWYPACDVEEADDHYLLALDLPGIPREQIKLEIVDNQLLISGERRLESRKRVDEAWYSERRFGKFHRSFALPTGVDAEKVEANYQDGTLRVYVPKADSVKPRQVKISSGAGAGFLGRLVGYASSKEKGDSQPSGEYRADHAAS